MRDITNDKYYAYQQFRAYQNGKLRGYLLAYQDDSKWVLEEIRAFSGRKGIGSALLRQFTAYVYEQLEETGYCQR